ncbi:MAG TPA: cupin domain-containing protein [Burkholderiales bacterium]|nr:cupin domain-containing protein [Burkholderiales bacterium]
MERRLLGGLTPSAFLRRHWQKRPLFVRGAFSPAEPIVDVASLLALGARHDVESRIVERRGRQRETRHGPFPRARPRARDWTILVSGVNLQSAAADRLLRRFAFIPQARLDDVMVSYATPGGGVGPHIDSYDVFLLQGPGVRRWTTWFSRGKQVYLCEPGDLLYLPPGIKHDGVALERCFTYSVGFRAPRGAELGAAFLDWLHERGLPDSRYGDPGLAPAGAPARLPAAMVDFARKTLARIRWSGADVETFLGEYLTLPKAHVVFRPRRSGRALRDSLVRLDPKTQLLYSARKFFINGESVALRSAALRSLADRRWAHGSALAHGALARLVSDWQRAGYVHFEAP